MYEDVLYYQTAPGCWSQWGSWSDCFDSTNCGHEFNMMNRTRSCTQGFGIFDFCEGTGFDSTVCSSEDISISTLGKVG